MLVNLKMPANVQDFIAAFSKQYDMSESEIIQKALMEFMHKRRLEAYKKDIEAIKNEDIETLSESEVFEDIENLLKNEDYLHGKI